MTDKPNETSIFELEISKTPLTEENKDPLISDSPLTPYTKPSGINSKHKEEDTPYCHIAPHGISQENSPKEFMKNLMDTPREIPNSPTPIKSAFAASGSSEELSLNLSASNSPMLERDLRHRLDEITQGIIKTKNTTKELSSKILAKEKLIKQDLETLDKRNKDLAGLKEQRDLLELRIEQRKNDLEKKGNDIRTLKTLHEKAMKDETDERNKLSIIQEDKENIRKEVEKLRTDLAREKVKGNKLTEALSRTEVEGSPGKRQSLYNEIQHIEDLIEEEKNLNSIKIQELGHIYKSKLNVESSNTSREIQSEIEEINLAIQQQMVHNDHKLQKIQDRNILETEEEIRQSERNLMNELASLDAEKLLLMEMGRELERNIRKLKDNPGTNWSMIFGLIVGLLTSMMYNSIMMKV
jgi:hypothetical protein